jgi:DNA-directed RNA polymerase specialized sigma24 family protein
MCTDGNLAASLHNANHYVNTDNSTTVWYVEDREIVAAIVAGDPSGLAAAYDKYAAPLHGYCRWMLREPAAADVVRETFAMAAAHLDLRDGGELRSWLYAVAREECSDRLGTDGAGFGADGAAFGDAGDRPGDDFGLGGSGSGFDGSGDGFGAVAGGGQRVYTAERTELRVLIRSALAGLKPYEREIVELSLRHHLADGELSAVLGITWSRAHALAAQARGHLERILAALLMARTGREDCPALDTLLTDWDGRLTSGVAGLVARHVDQCDTCASHRHGGLRPEVLSDLLPLPPLPEYLREQVLREEAPQEESPLAEFLHEDRAPEPVPSRRLAGFPSRRLASFPAWGKVRSNPGKTTAATALAMWLAAAASVTLLTVTGSHAVRALVAQSRPGTSVNAPAPAATGTSPGHGKGRGHPSHRAVPAHSQQGPGSPAPQAVPSATASPSPTARPSSSHSATPSRSPSRSPSGSASSSPSSSPTPTHSRSPSPSPSPTPSPSSTSPSPAST